MTGALVHQARSEKHVLWIVGPALGHVSRALLVARELKNQHDLESRFLGSDVHGFHGRLVGDEFPYRDLELTNTQFERFADEVVSHVRQTRPTVVVFDCSPTPWRLVMPDLSVPTVYLSNSFLLEPGARSHQEYVWGRFGALWQARRIERGLKPITNPLQLYECDLVLLADPAALLPHKSALPSHHRHVGACAWAPDVPLPPKLEHLQNVLLVSMGSTGKPVPSDLIDKLAVACGADNIVKMASGGSLEVNGVALQLGDVPGPALLARSCFALTHGGAGSSYQALSVGVPMAIWPTHHNHRILGRKLQELGVGVLLDASNYVEQIESLAMDIDAVFDRARRLRFDLSDGPQTAARVIKEYLIECP